MALEVSMTGTGTFGDIVPGWSVTEGTNSTAIGETVAQTGTVSFSAKSNDDSLLVINNDVISTVDAIGTLHGIVQSVSESGLSVSVTHGTVADKLNLDVQVQPVVSGGPQSWCSALEYAIGIGPNPYNAPVSYIPSYASNGASFGFFGSTVSSDFHYPLTQFLTLSTGFPATPSQTVGNGTLDSTQAAGNTTTWTSYTSTQLKAINVLPTWFSIANKPSTVGDSAVIQFSAKPDASTVISFGLSSGNTGYRIIADGSAETFSATTGTLSVNYSTLDDSEPLMFTIVMQRDTKTTYATYLYVTDHTGTKVSASDSRTGTAIYMPYHRVECNDVRFMNFYVAPYTIAPVDNSTYVEPVAGSGTSLSLFDFSGYTGTSNNAYPSTSGVAWELLQKLAAAENFEIAVGADKVYIRDVGLRTLDFGNYAVSPQVAPSSTLSGKAINIPYTEAYYVFGTVYDAADDSNNVISVKAGETTVTSVKHNVHPLYIEQPDFYPGTDWLTTPIGYAVMDSSGYYLNADEWLGYGGSVTVNIDPDDNAAIQITVTGPDSDVTLAGGPYELAVSDGKTKYAALTILGSGVYSGDSVLNLITGIDPEKYTRATINTITNPFISTLEQAYDRGVWASHKASGPVVSMNATIPTSAVTAIGETCGSLIQYRNSTYRVLQTTIGNVSTSITCERFVTVTDMDALWGSKTVAEYDSFWGSYECQDQSIFPYMEA